MLAEGEIFRIEKLSEKDSPGMSKTHIHDYYEIYYLVKGNRRYFINHTLYDLVPGDVMFIDMGDIHQAFSAASKDTEYERYLVHFSNEFLQKFTAALDFTQLSNCFVPKKLHIPNHQSRSILKMLDKLESEYNSEDKYEKQLAMLHAAELLLTTARYTEQKNVPFIEDPTVYEERIQDVCKYICNYYDKHITLNDISKIAFMSPTYFSKKFKKVTGFGFNEYLHNVRIKMAISMLIETDYSLTEIAMYCGYQDSNYFSDVFRKIMGISPSKYRKKHMDNR